MGPTKSFTFSPGDLRVAMCSLQHFPVIGLFGFVLASKSTRINKNEGYFCPMGFTLLYYCYDLKSLLFRRLILAKSLAVPIVIL